MSAQFPAFLSGFALGFSLILAIGAQNAFVLRQGLRGEHVLAVVLACALSDAVLISAGVGGMGAAVTAIPGLAVALRYGGAVFLTVYGLLRFCAAWAAGSIWTRPPGTASLGAALATCLALTWLNPHVYLDTVLLIGSVSARWPGARLAFAVGATAASFTFFFALGYGAALSRPVFSRPAAWRALDILIGLVMWTIAAGLVLGQ